MKGRGRKRVRGSSSRSSIEECAATTRTDLDAVDDPKPELNGVADGNCEEVGSFASRCSVRLIHEVVAKFCGYKKELVKALGFEGILYFPAIKQFNRRYVMWLMRRVRVESSILKIGEHIIVRFSKSDVTHVLGIPCTGKKVVDTRLSFREAKEAILNNFLGSRFRENRSIKLVQSIIERDYKLPMSKLEEDTFKVAFVVFVVSNLLAPSAKNDYASVDYWNAIADPGAVHTYDWADYVVVKLLEAVEKLNHDLSSNLKFPMITGCCIFLQVLYLDNLDFGELSTSHNSFPRVRDFSYDKIRMMIQADRNYLREIKADEGIPLLKLRDPSGCIYSWAVNGKCSG